MALWTWELSCEMHSVPSRVNSTCYSFKGMVTVWGSPRGYREQGIISLFSGEHVWKWNRGTKVILANRKLRKLRFWFWGTRKNAVIFQWNKGTGTTSSFPHPQLGGPLRGDNSVQCFCFTSVKVSPLKRNHLLLLGLHSFLLMYIHLLKMLDMHKSD